MVIIMKSKLKERIDIIDKSLSKYIPEKDNPQSDIYKAMRYSLFAGGKRLRPILMWEVCKMCGGKWETVEPFACAMEMIHTYSLIHDDLPAMDNDDLRRGMPTCHIKYGEALAILAGDALLNKAFEVITSHQYSNPAAVLKALNVLALSSGTEGMIGGQVVDIDSENKNISLSELKYIHLLKTGAIIRSSCIIGAILANASESEIKSIDEFAKNLGIAFQIRDDILDVTGTAAELGKPIGSDEKANKNTYVTMCGLKESKKLVEEYSEKAKSSLKQFGVKSDFLIELTNYLTDRKI